MEKNLVSIITPCYNSAAFIEATINSIQKQSYRHWELLITDDGSTDNSVEIVQEFIKLDPRIKLFQITNSGPAIARNHSIKHATGQYLAFLDSDDLWDSSFIQTSIRVIQDSEGFVFSSYRLCDELTLKPVLEDFIVPAKVTYSDILKTNSIGCLTAFIDIDKLGKELMPEVMYRQDMGLWLIYLKRIKYAVGIKQVLATYRIRKNSLSGNKFNLLRPQWYFYRKVEKLSFLQTIYYISLWAFYGFKKYKS